MEDLSYFNPEGSILRKHQMKMVDILCVIDKICKKHKINYWLSSGTLLGAVRHQGFIPWDDDLDIAMPIDDFEQLFSPSFQMIWCFNHIRQILIMFLLMLKSEIQSLVCMRHQIRIVIISIEGSILIFSI